MVVKLLAEHNLKFLILKGGCRGSWESTHVKMPHCWKSHAPVHLSKAYITNIHFHLHMHRVYQVNVDLRDMKELMELT